MRFSSSGYLEMYWKDEQRDKKYIIERVDKNDRFVNDFKIIHVNASSNVSNKTNHKI